MVWIGFDTRQAMIHTAPSGGRNGDVLAVVGRTLVGPTPQSRVGHHGLNNGTVTADGVDQRHTVLSTLEFKQQTNFVVQRVVEQVEGDPMRVGAKHAWNGLTCIVQDAPVEPRTDWNRRFDVQRHVGVVGERHRHARGMTHRGARPVGLGRRGEVNVIDVPEVAAGRAAAGLMQTEL